MGSFLVVDEIIMSMSVFFIELVAFEIERYSFICLARSADTVDENVCQVCHSRYDEEDEADPEFWIGCDGDCGWWFHFWCAGFKRKPGRPPTSSAQAIARQVFAFAPLVCYQ